MGVLWHQGETDSARDQDSQTYEPRLKQMILDLPADLGRPDLPVVVGQLGEFLGPPDHPYVDRVRQSIRQVARDLPGVGYVDSEGLADLGDRFAQQMRKRHTRTSAVPRSNPPARRMTIRVMGLGSKPVSVSVSRCIVDKSPGSVRWCGTDSRQD
ncbi:MAG: hypothetical protein KatS3mg104_2549 [Phycisphaerae bacterium]|nr:MAG: hypothetical protein KatS3mg104_2549 [Phycisphaerae bacterium]